MKTFITLLFALAFTTTFAFAQVPQKMSYQAIVRDSTGALVTNANISMRISLLQGSVTGTAVYVETHTATTNVNGLVSISIGTGTAVTGTFTSINWANTPYFISIETDISGGSNYTIMGVQELATVPYAFMAETANKLAPQAAKGLFTHYIGEIWGGGIVFNVYKDTAGVEHGLIATLKDLDTSAWSNMDTTAVGPAAQSLWDGKSNTQAIINQAGHITSAALICDTSTMGGQTDWYLPAVDEMQLLYREMYKLNNILRITPNTDPISIGIGVNYKDNYYSCSTEYVQQNCSNCSNHSKVSIITSYTTPASSIGVLGKKYVVKVRAIRSF